MMELFEQRTELLVGSENVERLHNANVLIVGVGGVGGVVAEMLCRSGIGNITIVDMDTISQTNINRQIIALHSTVGKKKTEVWAERLLDINPKLNLKTIATLIDESNTKEIILAEKYDFVVDAIDTLTPKVHLIKTCVENGIKIVSSMGAGAKLNPAKVQIADISKSYNCSLARMVRKRLGKVGIRKGIKVVFSSEKAIKSALKSQEEQYKKTITGTVSYQPAIFGLYISSYVIQSIIKKDII